MHLSTAMEFGTIRNQQGEQIDYAYHGADTNQDILVLVGHGVTGNKDRPFVTALAKGLAEAGFPSLRFSFSGNGDSEGKFTDSCPSKEVRDLQAVLDVVSQEGRTIVYAGHSMGGAVGVLAASQDVRIHKLISLAGMVHTKKFYEVEFGDQTPDEGCMWEDESCPLSSIFADDMEAIGSVLEKAGGISVPWLLVHGTEDDVVPIGETHEIFEKGGDNAEKVVLEGADHVFSSEEAKSRLVRETIAWLSK